MRVAALRRVAVLLFALSGLAHAESWTFGLIGDVPYSDYERAELPRMLTSMAEHNVELIAHIGDIKSGKSRCDDALYEDRKALFNASIPPFIYVPGDNEWTDCGRLSNGSYDAEERLTALRRIFFPEARSLGQRTIAVERQAGAYVEHTRFRVGPVLFVTLNVPGGNNNFGHEPNGSQEFHTRNKAVLAWLHASFLQARRNNLSGIVLLMQANPYFEHFSRGFPYRGYRQLLTTLRDETERYNGQVVLVHGDTHWSRIDHPLHDKAGGRIDNFTRVETYGYPVMGWTRGVIDTSDPKLFRFETHPWQHKQIKSGEP